MNFIKQMVQLAKKQKSKIDMEWDLLDGSINGRENIGKEVKNYQKSRNLWKKDWNK
jgi:hypothetical protein